MENAAIFATVFLPIFLRYDLHCVHVFNGNPAVGNLDSITVDIPSVYTVTV